MALKKFPGEGEGGYLFLPPSRLRVPPRRRVPRGAIRIGIGVGIGIRIGIGAIQNPLFHLKS